MIVEPAPVPNAPAPPPRDARKTGLPRPLLVVALILLIPVAVYLWARPLLLERQLRSATLNELKERAKTQETPRTLYYLGLNQREKGDLNAAHENFKRASQLDVLDADIWLAVADSAKIVEGDQSAFNILAEFTKNNPRNAPGHLALARLYMERRSYRRAREEARLAVANDASLAEAWRIAGQAALALELPGDAEPDLRRAVSLAPGDWESQTALGDALAARNRFQDSIPVYQEAARLAPKEPVPPLSLGRALLKAAPPNAMPEQLEPARQSLERSIALRNDIPIAHLILGQCLARQKKLPEAQIALERARDLAPADPDAYFELSRVASLRGDRAASAVYRTQHSNVLKRRNSFGDKKRTLIAKIDNAMGANQPTVVDSLRRELARLLVSGGETAEALQQYSLLLVLNPKDSSLQREADALRRRVQETALAQMTLPELLAAGDSLFQRERYPEASNFYGKALERNANSAAAAEGYGLTLEAGGRSEEATYYLLAATRLDPKRPRAEFALGMRYAQIGFLAEAQKRLRRVVALEPQNAAAWHALGTILRDKDGGEAEAEAAFQKAVDADKTNDAAYLIDLADMRDTNNKKAEAETIFRQALALAPDSGEANASLGSFLVNHPTDAARSDEAERLLTRALTLDPTDDFARYAQGKLALEKGDPARAIILLETVLKHSQNAESREIWYTLGRAYAKNGDRAKSEKALARSHKLETEGIAYVQAREQVSLRPNDPETHLNFARILARRGENARAITEYERTLRLSPKSAVARQELNALTARLQAASQMPSMGVYRALVPSAQTGAKVN